MSRALITIHGQRDRERVIQLARTVPFRTRVSFVGPRRSLPQNSKMWAMLTEISYQTDWYGQALPPNDWKTLFLDALKRERRAVPAMDGEGYVELGPGSSDLTKDEMTDLIELICEFGARKNVIFRDDKQPPN